MDESKEFEILLYMLLETPFISSSLGVCGQQNLKKHHGHALVHVRVMNRKNLKLAETPRHRLKIQDWDFRFLTLRKRQTELKFPNPTVFLVLFNTLVEFLCTKRMDLLSAALNLAVSKFDSSVWSRYCFICYLRLDGKLMSIGCKLFLLRHKNNWPKSVTLNSFYETKFTAIVFWANRQCMIVHFIFVCLSPINPSKVFSVVRCSLLYFNDCQHSNWW